MAVARQRQTELEGGAPPWKSVRATGEGEDADASGGRLGSGSQQGKSRAGRGVKEKDSKGAGWAVAGPFSLWKSVEAHGSRGSHGYPGIR